ncbi:MAG TPA: DUF1289 domain-containing protein [Polaromonas sp.]|uniref:DUF1289 domain-containing protein n=1 Tax=Polaromonas sp. TaxID=1869339 RepID=UPI002D7149AC|nr:DUF1289 domain-containing protein [Polaromonas sp.]HYW56216.1 DUF1289 domain-containing protein [Polaromonas sp.]
MADVAVDPVLEKQALAHAVGLVSERAREIKGQETDLPSPCISVCRMDARGLCEGCFRTGAEIAAWSQASDAHKRQVWTLIEQRMLAIQA